MQGVYSKMLGVWFLVSKLETDNDKVSSDLLNTRPEREVAKKALLVAQPLKGGGEGKGLATKKKLFLNL